MKLQRMAKQFRRSNAPGVSRRDFLKSTSALGALTLTDPALAAERKGDSDSLTDRFQGQNLTIFHAGSLSPPFDLAETAFEKHYGADVLRQSEGSLASTKKITELGRSAGVLGVSDYRLLRDRVLPEFGDWYAIFATNAMTIQYSPKSKGADEITADNWWEILSRPGVRVAHSDPAIDPAGYRAIMTMQLGKIPVRGERLYDEATYHKLRENSVVTTSTEINLHGQLESGKLDYVFYYQSIASTAGLPWINLQPSVDLSKATPEYAEHYAKAVVETNSGTFTGAPIAYGITVPSVAANPELGALWVKFMITEPGIKILRETGFVPVYPAVVPADHADAVPKRVQSHATAKDSLGPLAL